MSSNKTNKDRYVKVHNDNEGDFKAKIQGCIDLIWVDLQRENKSSNEITEAITECITVYRIKEKKDLTHIIEKTSPSLLCFDFDVPDKTSLYFLQEIKNQYPSLPILMLTEYHSEEFAVWAFLTGVRDFIVKPVAIDDIVGKIQALLRLPKPCGKYFSRNRLFPIRPIPLPNIFLESKYKDKKTRSAILYIATNYHKRISLDAVSKLANLSPSQFCRTFKKEQGITLGEYINHYRITKACELLTKTRTSVKEVAFSVGFSDLSYFAKLFRRYVGITPSIYRARNANEGYEFIINSVPLYLSDSI